MSVLDECYLIGLGILLCVYGHECYTRIDRRPLDHYLFALAVIVLWPLMLAVILGALIVSSLPAKEQSR